MSIILKIDTTKTEEIIVELEDNDGKKDKLVKKQQYGSQVLLPMIVQLLNKNNLTLNDLTAVEVNTGPGSFTGTRVGVTVANTLGFALNLPVNGLPRFRAGKKGKIVLPKYEKSKWDGK